MTQEKKSPRNKSLSGLHRSIPAQGLCWLGSFSLLSSGLVYAQTESAVDNLVPTTENSQPVRTNPAPSVTIERLRRSAPEASTPQVEFSERRSRLRARLNRSNTTQAEKPTVKLRTRLSDRTRTRPRTAQSIAIPTTRVRTPSSQPVIVTSESTQSNTQRSQPIHSLPGLRINTGNTEQPIKPEATAAATSNQINIQTNNPANNSEAAKVPSKDSNSAYLDPTEYKLKPSNKTDAANAVSPSAVIVRSRSGQCRVIGSNAAACVQVPVAANPNTNSENRRENIANRESDNSDRQGKPNWIRKSDNVRIAAAIAPHRRSVHSETQTGQRAANITNLATHSFRQRLTRVEHPTGKNDLNPNRFIPAPSAFANPNLVPTTVSSAPIAPKAGILPLPINANFTLPRASTVSYDIPLESTLPQIAYGVMPGVSVVASNPGGIIFPLSGPAPITSLFGWRNHPVTGDRRFHAGIDIGAPTGTPIVASAAGQVEIADHVGGYGLTVTVNHGNSHQTLYGHMSQIFVQPGQFVPQGAIIGLVGNTGVSTGPHLHFEVRQLTPNGWVAVDPYVQIQYALYQINQLSQAAQIQQPAQ